MGDYCMGGICILFFIWVRNIERLSC